MLKVGHSISYSVFAWSPPSDFPLFPKTITSLFSALLSLTSPISLFFNSDMPQVDIASVCAGGECKIACETLADYDPPPETTNYPSDFPPESFVLSKDAEEEWIDQNVFIERKNSGRSSSLHSMNTNSGSMRYSLTVKTKPSFLGLPKPQKAAYAEGKSRRPASIRLFPKRSGSSSSTNSRGGKSGVPASEPCSPKVSCIGRVRSRRDRSRRKQKRRNQGGEATMKRSRSVKVQKSGFWSNFRSMFSKKEKGHRAGKTGGPAPEVESVKKCKSVRKRELGGGGSAEAPSLGGVKRFSSGRRSDAWACETEVDGAQSEPLDRGGSLSLWSRRNGSGNGGAGGPLSL